jgi:prephenate dehydrogenase
MALGKYKVVEERWGYDVSPRAMVEARERGAVDETAVLSQALQDAELVILSMPVGQILKVLEEISPFLQKGALVTDVGSTKKQIVKAMESLLFPGVTGIGGHPIAGSEQAGIAAADPLLLENAIYLLTPTRQTPKPALEKMEKVIRAIRACPLMLGPEEHDRLVALVSHLPQLVAVALVNALRSCGHERELLLTLAGRGFKDTTRIAMGEPSMWYDIFTTNKVFLKDSLKIFLEELHLLAGYLEQENEGEAVRILENAGFLRRALH